MDTDEGAVWGEAQPRVQESRNEFLYSSLKPSQGEGASVQAKLNPMSGARWMTWQIVEELVREASAIAELSREVATWEEWDGGEEQQSQRSRKEEEWL